jgi:hypothetical protein
MRDWIQNEDGPECYCGSPTVVKDGLLVCFFHTSEEGCYFRLPPQAPDDWTTYTIDDVIKGQELCR